MMLDASEGGGGEPRQEDAVTRLSHKKMLRRVREMNKLASVTEKIGGAPGTNSLDDILREISEAKRQYREFLGEIQKARETQTRAVARRARLLDRKPFPHPRPWNDSPLLDPERERLTPEAIAGDAFLEFQETKRARKEEAANFPSCYKRVLEAHLEQAVATITKSYEGMEEGTLRLSNLKADVGAELWLMQSSLDEVRRGLKKANEEERLKLLARGKQRPRNKTPENESGKT